MRGISILHDITSSIRETIADRFSCHLGGSSSGLYVRIPGTTLSMWMELRDRSMGLAHQRSGASDHEVFIGRLHLILSDEGRTGGVEA
jgi:hypothetical protein